MNLTTISTLLVLFAITWGLIADSMWPVAVLFVAAALNELLVIMIAQDEEPE